MLKRLSLTNFKCFRDKTSAVLSDITLLYGKNGRGKSSFVQSLLLVSQTIRETNDIRVLKINGEFVKLGNFKELVNDEGQGFVEITFGSENETVVMTFREIEDRKQSARLSSLIVNEEERMAMAATDGAEPREDASEESVALTISDIFTLQSLKSTAYICAERLGPRNSSPVNDSLDENRLSIDGSDVINVLAAKGPDFQKNVANALSKILTGVSLKVETNDSDRIELLMNSADGDKLFRPVNVGFGYSYVLPVVVAALLAKKGSTLIIENPEAHLHPGAQSRLMEFLIGVSKSNEVQMIIETHSDHIVNGLCIAVKKGVLTSDDAEVLFFSNDSGTEEVSTITVDSNGVLSEYPDDFVDEWTRQMLQLV